MLLLAASALLASAAPVATPTATSSPAAPVKPKRVCRTEEAVTGSITPKRICVTVPQGAPAQTAQPVQDAASDKPKQASETANN